MRRLALAFLAPFALAACGDDDHPIVVNTPPAVAAPAPSTVLVPAQPQQPSVIIERR